MRNARRLTGINSVSDMLPVNGGANGFSAGSIWSLFADGHGKTKQSTKQVGSSCHALGSQSKQTSINVKIFWLGEEDLLLIAFIHTSPLVPNLIGKLVAAVQKS
jgi:hypothetical protein